MRLFHAISIYQLMVCMTLNLRQPTEEVTVCILPDFIVRKFPAYQRLEACHVFDKVVLYPYRKVPYPYTEQSLRDIGDALYREAVPYPLEAFDEIYCAATQFAFASYLSLKRVPFYYIEEGAGVFMGMQRYKKMQATIQAGAYQIAEAFGLNDASSPLIRRIFADFPDGTSFDDPRVIRCNLPDELRQLPRKTIQVFRKIFGAEGVMIPRPEDSLLFLTQHPANLQILSLEGQRELVTLTVDYYFRQKYLVIKPHPDDFLYNQRLFPDATVLPKLFPIELLLDFVDNERAHVMTVTSHAIDGMKARDKIDFDDPYLFGEFRLLHVCYAVAQFVKACGERHLAIYHANRKIFQNWELSVQDAGETQGNLSGGILYAETLDDAFAETIWHQAEEMHVCLMVHRVTPTLYRLMKENPSYVLIAREVVLRPAPGERAQETPEDVLRKTEYERLYFFVPQSQIEAVRAFSYRRTLKYARKVAAMQELTEEEMEIARLKGILEATERRLEAVLKENAELQFEIKSRNS